MRWILIAIVSLLTLNGGPRPDLASEPGRSSSDVASAVTLEPSPTPATADEGVDALGRFAELALAVSDASPTDDELDDLDEEDLAILLDQPLRWHTDYETVLALSKMSGKPIFARFR